MSMLSMTIQQLSAFSPWVSADTHHYGRPVQAVKHTITRLHTGASGQGSSPGTEGSTLEPMDALLAATHAA